MLRAIPGFPGYYADEYGLIHSERSGMMRVLAQVMHRGYPHVFVRTGRGNGTRRKLPVHSLVLRAFAGPRPDGCVCRHLNGNPRDNRLQNLRWGTYQENAQDAVRHGTAACLRRGEDHAGSRLKNADVLEIKRLARAGVRRSEIAALFGVTTRHVGYIVTGALWSHI